MRRCARSGRLQKKQRRSSRWSRGEVRLDHALPAGLQTATHVSSTAGVVKRLLQSGASSRQACMRLPTRR
jgi:hypothetical protein